MRNIVNSEIVKREIERIRNVKGDAEGRNIEYDISLFKKSVESLEKLVNKKEDVVFIDSDMWAECHKSLGRVMNAYDLEVDEIDEKNFGFTVVRKKYWYEMLRRPIGIGNQPKGFADTDESRGNWGLIAYDRQLSEEELKEYEMIEWIE